MGLWILCDTYVLNKNALDAWNVYGHDDVIYYMVPCTLMECCFGINNCRQRRTGASRSRNGVGSARAERETAEISSSPLVAIAPPRYHYPFPRIDHRRPATALLFAGRGARFRPTVWQYSASARHLFYVFAPRPSFVCLYTSREYTHTPHDWIVQCPRPYDDNNITRLPNIKKIKKKKVLII